MASTTPMARNRAPTEHALPLFLTIDRILHENRSDLSVPYGLDRREPYSPRERVVWGRVR
jgi:hypothetical protein